MPSQNVDGHTRDAYLPTDVSRWVNLFANLTELLRFSHPVNAVVKASQNAALQSLLVIPWKPLFHSYCFHFQLLRIAIPVNLTTANMNNSSHTTSSTPRPKLAGILHQSNKAGKHITSTSAVPNLQTTMLTSCSGRKIFTGQDIIVGRDSSRWSDIVFDHTLLLMLTYHQSIHHW